MIWIGHLSLGYLVYRAVLAFYSSGDFPSFQLNWLLAIVLIASILPDMDLISFFRKNKSIKLQKDSSHRTQISHAPVIYLLIGIVAYALSSTLFFKVASLLFIFGILSHFIGDSIEYGIMWLWPISNKQFPIHKTSKENIKSKSTMGYYWEFFWRVYVRNWTFYIELVALMIVIILLAH